MPKELPSVILQDVVLTDIQRMNVATSPIMATFAYRVRDDSGEVHHHGHLTGPMPPSLKSALAAWVTDTVLPAINNKEGMS